MCQQPPTSKYVVIYKRLRKLTQHSAIEAAQHVSRRRRSMDLINRPIKRPITQHNIREAVRLWCQDPVEGTAWYGRIEEWNTSEVTHMDRLFEEQPSFNDDISGWDVSQVRNMRFMFRGAINFNQNLSEWNVSNVTNMRDMFKHAIAFNQDLSGWDVSEVTDMRSMFCGAYSFDKALRGWNVSKVTNMSCMFCNATSFNQNLSEWDVSHVTNMSFMFRGATSLEATLRSIKNGNVSSFFLGIYHTMPQAERREIFNSVFRWHRRKSFMIFLVNHGYLYSASVASNYEHQAP